MVNATVAAEDRTFWTNDGVDYPAIVRAALANYEAGSIVQGASTITQQVIKYAGSIEAAEQARDSQRLRRSVRGARSGRQGRDENPASARRRG